MKRTRSQLRRNGNQRTLLCGSPFGAAIFLFVLTLRFSCLGQSSPALSVHEAVEHGLQFMRKEAFHWKSTRHCAACHHADTMIWTFNEARARGYSVDEKALNEITSWAFGDMKTNSLAEEAPPRNVVNLGWVYVLLSMETSPSVKLYSSKAAGVRAAEQLGSADGQANATAWHTLVQQIANKQAPDGGWGHPLDERVPLGGPVEDIAVLCRLALLESGDSSESVTNSISKASEWLQHNADKTSRQNRNLRLLMNLYEKKRQSELKPVIQAILAEQNADGGWSQTREMTSDAYATGQTLYVLARAGVKPKVPAMRRGVDFLVRTQRSDGSWPMISRVKAKDLSPITGAGTAWALLGVLRASN